MKKAVVIIPFPQLIEAYRAADFTETVKCFRILEGFLISVRDVDVIYAYMVAKDWIKWVRGSDGRDNPLSGKQKNYRRHLEVFKSFAQWCEQAFDKEPEKIEAIICELREGTVAGWYLNDSTEDELTYEHIHALRLVARYFAKKGNSKFEKILLEKGVPLMSD